MADISKITLPSGTTYDIKDAVARSFITSGVKFIGKTSTAISDESTTNPITINGNSVTATSGNLVVYGKKEFIFDGTKWLEFGDLGTLKALAFKDSASGNFTPQGTVSQPTFNGSETTSTGKFTPAGSVAISTGTGAANYTPGGSVAQPTFTGTETESTGTFTPSGNVSKPDISVTPSSTTVNSITAVGSLPSLSCTVASETLTLSWDAGTLPTKGSNTSVLTGVSAALASAPTFTGTSATVTVTGTPSGTVSKPAFTGTGVQLKATFTGTEGNVSVKGTPSGTVTQPTFSGTQGTVTVS